jgi:uncharacterized protein (TIGR02594 family)
MNVTAFDIAQRFTGVRELPGQLRNPQIMAMLQLDQQWPEDDSVAWCSAFVNYVAWLLRLPRSKNLLARSWLGVGVSIQGVECKVGFDVVILRRGLSDPPATNLTAGGHVGFYAGFDHYPPTDEGSHIYVLGGNQGDTVSIAPFRTDLILGIRRLYEEAAIKPLG